MCKSVSTIPLLVFLVHITTGGNFQLSIALNTQLTPTHYEDGLYQKEAAVQYCSALSSQCQPKYGLLAVIDR
jgi:hypothetical protein